MFHNPNTFYWVPSCSDERGLTSCTLKRCIHLRVQKVPNKTKLENYIYIYIADVNTYSEWASASHKPIGLDSNLRWYFPPITRGLDGGNLQDKPYVYMINPSTDVPGRRNVAKVTVGQNGGKRTFHYEKSQENL